MTTVTASGLFPPHSGWSEARRRVFETAIVLFGERGFHGVSVRDLMAEIGLQPGALYAHVASKQQLLYELVRIGFDGHRRRLRDALLEAGSDPVDQVRAITRAHVLTHLTYPDLANVANREERALSPDQRADLEAIRQDAAQLLLDVIDRGTRMGLFRAKEPALAVAAIDAMGIRAAERLRDSPYTKEQIAETYADYAVSLLSGKRTP